MMNKRKNKREEEKFVILQVTLFDDTKRYKPISTLIKVESVEEYKRNSTEYKRQAIQKICNQKYMTGKELIALGYKTIKVRNWTRLQEIKKKG